MTCEECGNDMIKFRKTEIYKCDCGQLQHSGKTQKHEKERYIYPASYVYDKEAKEQNPWSDIIGFK